MSANERPRSDSEATSEEWRYSSFSSIGHLGHDRQQSETNSATELLRRDAFSASSGDASEAKNGLASSSPNERNNIIEDVLGGPLRHLGRQASQSSFTTDKNRHSRVLTPITEQRHPGKEGLKISKSTRIFEPDLDEEDESSMNGSRTIAEKDSADEGFLCGLPLAFLIVGLCLAVFLISIDRTIITTAIPYITAEFKSTPDIGWYGSSYLLTACAFQPLFGRVFTLFSIKWSYLFALVMFEGGSLLCALAPDSMSLIIGRAIAGFGSAGILTGSFVVVATAVPLTLRPIYTAVVGLMFGVGATAGPLLGGVFTDLVTWRWCFYMNLPVGGATFLAMILFFHPKANSHVSRTFLDRVFDLDIIGNVIILGASIMLFLALEYTTVGAAWGSALIVGLLCGFGGAAVTFVVWQWWKQDGALIPPAIATQRTVAASCAMAFMTYGALLVITYFLPIWFQAIRDDSAIQSGINMIPFFVTNAFFSLLAGVFVSVIGYYTPPAIIGSAIGTVGCGVLTLLSQETTTAQWVGYEILVSAGFGLSIQQGFTAVQAALGAEDMAVGTAAVVASQSLGGAIFISVGNSVFQSQLQKASDANALPGVNIQEVINAGAASFRDVVSAEQLPALLEVYNRAIQVVLTVAIPLGGLALVACCCMEWRSVKPKKAGKQSNSSKERKR